MDSNLLQVIFWSLVGGLFSLVGGIALLASKKMALSLTKLAVPFSGGALLGAVFADLLKEAVHDGVIETALTFTMIGIIVFFVLEKSIHWVHHHHDVEHDAEHQSSKASLIIIGDTMHNFIDGLAMGSAFLIGPASGILTALIVAVHEIPQEVGDFGLLLSKGLSRRKVLIANVVSALASTIGAVLLYVVGGNLSLNTGAILGLTAGFFIYIAVSDIILTIHKQEAGDNKFIGTGTLMMIAGALFVTIATNSLHGIIDENSEGSDHDHDHDHESSLIISNLL